MKIVNCELKIRQGFTLVELLVAVSILVLVLGAAVSVEVSNLKLASRDEHYLQATDLAQEQLNLVKTVRDDNIKNDPKTPFLKFSNGVLQLNLNAATKQWGLGTAPAAGKKVTIDGKDYFIKIQVPSPDPVNLP